MLAANPTLQSWFKAQDGSDADDVIVAAWRLEHQNTRYLLLQHDDPAMTGNGAHDLRFDLLATSGAKRGRLHTFKEISGLFSQFVGREHTVARVMTTDRERLIIAIPGTGEAAIVCLNNGLATSIIDMVEPTLLCGFSGAAGQRLIEQSNCDGSVFCLR